MICRVYFIKNKDHKIVYTGITSYTINKRFREHKCSKKLDDSYYIELVQDNLSLKQARDLERELIAKYNLVKDGLNSSYGVSSGGIMLHTEKTKKLLREQKLGKKLSPNHLESVRKANAKRIGTKLSKEHIDKVVWATTKRVYCFENGETYLNCVSAAKALNLTSGRISSCCRGEHANTKGYSFKYLENNSRAGIE